MASRNGKSQTNSFSGGMNLDVDKSLLKENQYRYAENIRTVAGNGATTGSLTNIEGSTIISNGLFPGESVIHTTTIRDYGIVFTVNSATNKNQIYKMLFNADGSIFSSIKLLTVAGINLGLAVSSHIDTVGRYEDKYNIKIYWSDGSNYMRLINIAANNTLITDAAYFDIIPSVGFETPIVTAISSGSLNAGAIQYCYQLVSVNGSESYLSQLSKKVYITDSNVGNESIDFEGTELGDVYGAPAKKAVAITIPVSDYSNFKYIKVISVYYYNTGDAPVISVVGLYDIATYIESGVFTVKDSGTSTIGELTIEEFNAIGGNMFVPKHIESKDNILFAANLSDSEYEFSYDTRAYQYKRKYTHMGTLVPAQAKLTSAGGDSIYVGQYLDVADVPTLHDCIHSEIYEVDRYADIEYRYDVDGNLGGSGVNVSYSFSNTYFIESYGNYWGGEATTGGSKVPGLPGGDISGVSIKDRYIDMRTARIGDVKRPISSLVLNSSNGSTTSLNIEDIGISAHDGFLNYANPLLADSLRSYQRDEIYRFAAVFYDSKGRKSEAKWIADIRFPAGYIEDGYDANIFENPLERKDEAYNGTILEYQELLVKPLGITFKFSNLDEIPDLKRIEIVRAKRDINNKTVYAQGVVQKVGTKKKVMNDPSEMLDVGLLGSIRPYPVLSMYHSFGIAPPVLEGHSKGFVDEWIFGYEVYRDLLGTNGYESWRLEQLAPIHYNRNYLMFVNPETSFYGDAFVSDLSNAFKSAKLDIVDCISPITTPTNKVDGAGVVEPYWGGNTMAKASCKNGSGFNFVSMLAGADLNKFSRASGYSPADIGTMSTLGMVGADSYSINGSPSIIPTYIDTNDADIYNSSQVQYTLPGKKAVISLGGFINMYSDTHDCRFHNGFSPDALIDDGKGAMTSKDVWDRKQNAVAFKYFNRVFNYDSGAETIGLLLQRSSLISDFSTNDIPNLSQPIVSGAIKLTFDIDEFKYSNLFGSTEVISNVSPSKYVSLGYANFINYCSPLAPGDYADELRSLAQTVAKGRSVGPHGDGIVFSFDSDNIVPSIYKISMSKTGYADGYIPEQNRAADKIATAAMSTFVANMKSMSGSIYGGNTTMERQMTEYISTGFSINVSGNTEDIVTFGGDTFIGLFDYTIQRYVDPQIPSYQVETSATGGRHGTLVCQNKYIGALLPLESSINMHLVNSKSYVADDYNPMINPMPGSYGPGLTSGVKFYNNQTGYQYAYNAAYSAENIAIGFASKLLIDKSNKLFDCRVASSGIKKNDELLDSWSKFKPADYIDVDTESGEITRMKTFKNRLMFWQENSFGILSVNERSLITDSNISELTLGTGGVLSRFDYISTSNGLSNKTIQGIGASDAGLYWYDANKKELCSYSDGLDKISKTRGIQNIFNLYGESITDSIPMVYDSKYNELLITMPGIGDLKTID